MTPAARHRSAMVAVGFGAALGAAVAIIAPRGPVDSGGALALLGLALLVGAGAGWLTRSRWAILGAPLGYAVLFELLGDHAGMTAGPPDLSSGWGVAAALAGRLLHGAVALLPLAYGAALGAGVARRRVSAGAGARSRVWRAVRRSGAAILGLAMLLLTWQLARPATVPSPAGPRPVAEFVRVPRDDATLWLAVRGGDRRNPVVLYLPGGPGQSDLGVGRALLAPLTPEFTVAILDGRGVGKAYASFDADAMRTDRLVDDVIAAADALRRRFGQRRILLFGESAGSLLGVLAVDRAPDRFAAWFGSGQMVDPLETDRRIRTALERELRRRGDATDLEHLRRLGSPPYANPADYAWIAARYELISGTYDPPAAYTARLDAAAVGPLGLAAPEYTLVDRFGAARGLMDTFAAVYPRWQQLDLRRDVRTLDVPLHVFIGDHELAGRRAPADEWFRQVSAPWKQWHEVPRAGHAAAFERIDLFRAALRAEAQRTNPSGPPR